jgi:hypothetical protein
MRCIADGPPRCGPAGCRLTLADVAAGARPCTDCSWTTRRPGPGRPLEGLPDFDPRRAIILRVEVER